MVDLYRMYGVKCQVAIKTKDSWKLIGPIDHLPVNANPLMPHFLTLYKPAEIDDDLMHDSGVVYENFGFRLVAINPPRSLGNSLWNAGFTNYLYP